MFSCQSLADSHFLNIIKISSKTTFNNKKFIWKCLWIFFLILWCSVYLLVLVFSTFCVTYFSMAMANTSTTNTDVLYTVVILRKNHKKYIYVFSYLYYGIYMSFLNCIMADISTSVISTWLNPVNDNFKGMTLQKATVRQPTVKPVLTLCLGMSPSKSSQYSWGAW